MTKGLEALKYISNFTCFQNDCYKDKLNCIETELKVLEIIKEHFNFDKDDIFEMDYKGKHYYMFFGRPIKKEKYDLLKKILLDEENN